MVSAPHLCLLLALLVLQDVGRYRPVVLSRHLATECPCKELFNVYRIKIVMSEKIAYNLNSFMLKLGLVKRRYTMNK